MRAPFALLVVLVGAVLAGYPYGGAYYGSYGGYGHAVPYVYGAAYGAPYLAAPVVKAPLVSSYAYTTKTIHTAPLVVAPVVKPAYYGGYGGLYRGYGYASPIYGRYKHYYKK
ncbi:shematrin-like protein 3 [Varroa jacobsoni]|uniref:shematrin-like protein 3 n=1 Tax=Varroa jacobsoni TaxID=62625 RepID=UPI000BF41ADD|nr:shematrin-like protein 3 [Varroa jacobsoni]